MKIKKTLIAFTLILALFAAGCGETDTPTDTPADDDTGETISDTGPIPFSELNDTVMSTKESYDNLDGYSKYTFENGEGDCVDQGLTEFAYHMDEDLGYFIVSSDSASYREELAYLDFTGNVRFKAFTLPSDEATCNAKAVAGSDDAETECYIPETDEQEKQVLCTATYKVFAHK